MSFSSEWRAVRAFKRVPRAERRIVFLSESAQDWHHTEPVVRHLVDELRIPVLYVASEPGDPGLHLGHPLIRGFCVGKGFWRISFCQFLEADVLVTQILDFGNLELKRSVHPVHYVYMFHSLISTHMADRAESFDNYDTILCAGPHQAREIRKREAMHDLPAKQLLPHGYGRLESLMAERREPPAVKSGADVHVLVAPSWGEQTILPVCGAALVDTLLDAGFRVTLRPHYQTRWATPEVIDRIVDRHRRNPRFALVEQMGESDSLFDSHIMITDWSGAGQDYGMGLEKPVLYIDVPPKARNDAWPELGIEPFESYVRDKLGALLAPARIDEAPGLIRALLADPEPFRRRVASLRADWVYNLGSSGRAGAEAIRQVAEQARRQAVHSGHDRPGDR